MKRTKPKKAPEGSPFLRTISLAGGGTEHPFTVPAFSNGIAIELEKRVTFLVGENGSGKSSLLETIAEKCDFDPQGGSRDHQRSYNERSAFAQALRLSWSPRVTEGFFLRAESFFNFATYLEERGSSFSTYGGKSLHAQSHGEAFLALFANRFEQGFYLLDEPEAALSPQRQLSFLKIIHELTAPGHAQFLIATHSPILLAFPGAAIFHLDDSGISPIEYRDTDHYRVTRDFLNAPERFFKHLFADEPG
jgi:predicted ATPase